MPLTNSLRNTLLACLVLLGIQFLFPQGLHAAYQPVLCEEITAPTEAEDEGAASELEQELLSYALIVERLHGAIGQKALAALVEGNADRSGLWLLPAAGVQPAAP